MANKIPSVRSAARNSFNRAFWSDVNGLKCTDRSRTVQDQKDDADINVMVRNFGVTGKFPDNIRVPSYGDFDGISDYREAIEAVRLAEESFMALPSEFRDRLGNSPQRFLEFCADPGNLEEMRKLGLAVALAPPPTENPA